MRTRMVILLAVMASGISGCGKQTISVSGEERSGNVAESEFPDSMENENVKESSSEEDLTGKAEVVSKVPVDKEQTRVEPKRTMEEIYELIETKQYPYAILSLVQMEDNPKARELEDKLRYLVAGDNLLADEAGTFVVALGKDKKVQIATAKIEGIDFSWVETVSRWDNLKSIYQTRLGPVFVEESGVVKPMVTYVECSDFHSPLDDLKNGLYGVKDVKSVSQTHYNIYYALRDGSISRYNDFGGWTHHFEGIEDVVKVSGPFALLRNGTIRILEWNDYLDKYYKQIETWTDIVDIDWGGMKLVALRADGTALLSNWSQQPFCLDKWENLISIKTDLYHIIGLKQDGTVLVTETGFMVGYPDMYLEMEGIQDIVSDWTDIVTVDVSQSSFVGLKANGEILIAEHKTTEDSQFSNAAKPYDIDTSVFHDLYIPSVVE
ncbi:MAG: hypothetical protein ACI4HQ_04445 [Acetatifactor sp.]